MYFVIIAISVVALFILDYLLSLRAKPKHAPEPDIRGVTFDRPQFFGFVTKVPLIGVYPQFVQAHSVAEACAALNERGVFPLDVFHIGEVPDDLDEKEAREEIGQ